MDENSQGLTIGTFARVAGVNVETIRSISARGCCRSLTSPTGASVGMEPRTSHGFSS